jgi:hypothetical protein
MQRAPIKYIVHYTLPNSCIDRTFDCGPDDKYAVQYAAKRKATGCSNVYIEEKVNHDE